MQSAICSGKVISSLPLSITCLMAFPAKQCIIYISSMALCRLSAGMKMCNFPWAEIISSAPALLHLLFSNISVLTFCHRIVHWWFSQGEDTHKDKSNKIFYVLVFHILINLNDGSSFCSSGWNVSGMWPIQAHPSPPCLDSISWLLPTAGGWNEMILRSLSTQTTPLFYDSKQETE